MKGKLILLSELNETSDLDLTRPGTYVTTLASFVGYEDFNYKEKKPSHVLYKSQSNTFFFYLDFITNRTTQIKITTIILGKDSEIVEEWYKVKENRYYRHVFCHLFPGSWRTGCYEMIVYISSTKPLSDGGTVVSTCRFQIKN